MCSSLSRFAGRRSLTRLVPPMTEWHSYPRALANLLIFGLVALAGTWLVHQTEYRIEYGSRFGTVMATTPHRVYMAPFGVFLAIGVMGFVVASLLTLHLA